MHGAIAVVNDIAVSSQKTLKWWQMSQV